MAKLLTFKTPKTTTPKLSRRRREHIPPLNPLELQAALQQLEQSTLPAAARAQLAAMVTAAANPASEHPAVVAMTLPGERRANVERTARKITRLTSGVTARGRAALDATSDDEWNALLDDDA
jgi:hypothetical protein